MVDVLPLAQVLTRPGAHPALRTLVLDLNANPITLDDTAALVAAAISRPGLRCLQLGLARLPPVASTPAHLRVRKRSVQRGASGGPTPPSPFAEALAGCALGSDITSLHLNLAYAALPPGSAAALSRALAAAAPGCLREVVLSLAGQTDSDATLPAALAAILDAPVMRGLHRCVLTLAGASPALVQATVTAVAAGRLAAPALTDVEIDLARVPLGADGLGALCAALARGGLGPAAGGWSLRMGLALRVMALPVERHTQGSGTHRPRPPHRRTPLCHAGSNACSSVPGFACDVVRHRTERHRTFRSHGNSWLH